MDKELIKQAIVKAIQKFSVEKPEYNLAVIDDESIEFFGTVFGYIETGVERELRSEVNHLKDTIALSEDSQLMDQYIKAEREIARQTERIYNLEIDLAETTQAEIFLEELAADHERELSFLQRVFMQQSALIEKYEEALHRIALCITGDTAPQIIAGNTLVLRKENTNGI